MAQPYKNWTKEEDQRLLAMRAAAKGPVLVAKELRRTEAAVVARTGVLKALAAAKGDASVSPEILKSRR
jgi:hypothetical protein